jgi:hypothetical protein
MVVRSVVGRASTRIAGTCLLASAAVGAVGVVSLVGMFAAFAAGAQETGERLGYINDVSAFPTLLLAVPTVIELRRLLRPTSPLAMDVMTVVAIGSIAGVLTLQWLLVTRALTFEQQFGPVMVAYLGLQAWYLVSGWLASRSGVVPRGGRLGVAAVTYVGYPIWAVSVGRRLRELADVRTAQPLPAASR